MSAAKVEPPEIHAYAHAADDRTLCGDVCEGDPVVDLEVPTIAQPGQRVTCAPCLRIIAAVHENFTKAGRVKR